MVSNKLFYFSHGRIDAAGGTDAEYTYINIIIITMNKIYSCATLCFHSSRIRRWEIAYLSSKLHVSYCIRKKYGLQRLVLGATGGFRPRSDH